MMAVIVSAFMYRAAGTEELSFTAFPMAFMSFAACGELRPSIVNLVKIMAIIGLSFAARVFHGVP